MPPTIHLVRHAQGFHNLSEENTSLPDPDLTPLGEQQCADLRASFPSHARLAKLVASPMRRTIRTCELSFGGAPSQAPYPIVLLDVLQEASDAPCDTGSSKDALLAEFGGAAVLDVSRVGDGWTDKRAGSAFEPTFGALTARARSARRALREMLERAAAEEGGGGDVAVVTHGGFLHFLTDDWEGIPEGRSTAWTNCMCRSYTLARCPDDEDDVLLVETEESRRRRRHVASQPLSLTEKREFRAVTQARIAPYLKVRG